MFENHREKKNFNKLIKHFKKVVKKLSEEELREIGYTNKSRPGDDVFYIQSNNNEFSFIYRIAHYGPEEWENGCHAKKWVLIMSYKDEVVYDQQGLAIRALGISKKNVQKEMKRIIEFYYRHEISFIFERNDVEDKKRKAFFRSLDKLKAIEIER